MKPERILLQVALLMGGLAAQNVGIGTNTPTHLGVNWGSSWMTSALPIDSIPPGLDANDYSSHEFGIASM
jgi:hypothetical protein